jgi:hypothetical protein
LLKFSFSTLVADNLAAHFMGGYQTTFSTGHFCRRCFITYPDRNLPMSVTKFDVRTTINHDNIVEQINTSPHKSGLMGVVGQSVLQDLDGFHPTMALPADLMHDFLEGTCPLVIVGVLKEASTKRLLTYGENSLHLI